jgi:hypothetical protein
VAGGAVVVPVQDVVEGVRGEVGSGVDERDRDLGCRAAVRVELH